MDFVVKYSMPILAALIICLFYTGLPLLSHCSLREEKSSRKMDLPDWLTALILTLIYALTAFTNLGSMTAPQSFWKSGDEGYALLEFQEITDIDTIRSYAGVNNGSYNIEVSSDGREFEPVLVLEQIYTDILCWKNTVLESPLEDVRYIRISSSGQPWLGELAFYSQGERLSYLSSAPALNDETELIPNAPSHLNGSYFDEIYHARTALEHMESINPYEISHPPLGKLIISIGISLFGITPFGWRFMGTLFGVLMLPLIYAFAKKLFGGRAAPAACGILLSAEFMHFTQTRIATIDTYAVFFILLMYLFMYLWLTEQKLWQLFLCGLFFGLGASSKWTCLYAGAGLALLWALYWITRGRRLGFKAFIKNSLWCLLFFVLIPCLIYYLSYYPYGTARGLSGIGAFFTKEYFDTVISNQQFMFSYHVGVDATHPYSSMWYEWIFNIRPILYYLQYFDDGTRSSFGAFMNPAICWAGIPALVILAYTAIARRDKIAGFLLIGYLAQLLPWVFVPRLTFAYHYFPCSVFLVLALGYVFRLMQLNTRRWQLFVFGFCAFCAALFILFYPALSGEPVEAAFADKYIGWLPTWPF